MVKHRAYSDTELNEWLLHAGIRPSVQRMAILGYLNAHKDHPTVDEIFRSLAPKYGTLSRTTVYNTLHLFVERGVVREVDIEPGTMRYDLAAYVRHGHFLCRQCGRIFDLHLPSGLDFSPEDGFAADSIDIYYKGLCPECQEINGKQ